MALSTHNARPSASMRAGHSGHIALTCLTSLPTPPGTSEAGSIGTSELTDEPKLPNKAPAPAYEL